MAVTGKEKKLIEFRSEKLANRIVNLIKGVGNPPMRIERVIVLKAENIQVLASNIYHWLEAHANAEYLWAQTSKEKDEWRCEIHYMSEDVDPPE
jgi:hypothetical protein